jgi:hypothetical protein
VERATYQHQLIGVSEFSHGDGVLVDWLVRTNKGIAMSEKAKGFTHDNANNKSVDWYTPAWVFEKLGLQFDLDPCSPAGGIPWIPATNHFSLADDGLSREWFGRVWLNPPYGKHTPAWLERMHEHRNGIALVFARTDCAWFHDYCAKSDGILFLRGRISFVDGLGVTGGSGAGCGSMLVAWGKDNMDALREMRSMGHLVAPR